MSTVLMAFSFLSIVLSLWETKSFLELGYRVKVAVDAHLFFCFYGSLHQLQNHTTFARICSCKMHTLTSPSLRIELHSETKS